ncbi:DUF3501 family protein [Thiobacter aerophilum]|uniref:DUF3501 family protein n=1 Tax=Thiobacter aerophilum TaxID=3121275 RepID=A0ABV0EII5_9BURK
MPQLTRSDLLSLEAYAKARPQIRAKVMAHKKNRTVHLGDHMTLIFEDALTISYQVQEMLRAERIFEEEGIQDELDAYNPLIPDGTNWKVTQMIEYPDLEERRIMLERLKGIEDQTWVRIAGFDKVYAIADEDLERENEEKTSSVHFLRFELTPEMIAAVKRGAAIGVGVDHPEYTATFEPLPPAIRASLANDLA